MPVRSLCQQTVLRWLACSLRNSWTEHTGLQVSRACFYEEKQIIEGRSWMTNAHALPGSLH